jgi:hypothetical protein
LSEECSNDSLEALLKAAFLSIDLDISSSDESSELSDEEVALAISIDPTSESDEDRFLLSEEAFFVGFLGGISLTRLAFCGAGSWSLSSEEVPDESSDSDILAFWDGTSFLVGARIGSTAFDTVLFLDGSSSLLSSGSSESKDESEVVSKSALLARVRVDTATFEGEISLDASSSLLSSEEPEESEVGTVFNGEAFN